MKIETGAFILGFVIRWLPASGFYYGKSTNVTVAQAKAECETLGMRLAVFNTQSEWEAGKAFLQTYNSLWGKDKNVWIGLERDASQAGMVYKWIDGTTLSWGQFYNTPWKNASTPVDDVNKACVKMEWGASLLWIHNDCTATEDFLCEGFHMNPATISGWSAAKSTCEGMGMKLASLTSAEINEAAIKYINVQQNSGSVNDVWFGLSLSGGQYVYEDGTVITSGVYGIGYNSYPWRSSEPNNPNTDFCIRLASDGGGVFRWADWSCSTSYNFLCQVHFTPVTTTTTTPTPTTTTTTTTPTPTTTTPTQAPSTSTTQLVTTTKPWWFVEYSADGKAIGANGKTFDESVPPARFGAIGLCIGFSTFAVLMTLICLGWFCCIRSKDDYRFVEEEEDEKETKKTISFTPISQKPHGLQYTA